MSPAILRGLLCFNVLLMGVAVASAQTDTPYVEGEVIVGLSKGRSATDAEVLRKELGATVTYRFSLVHAEVWRITEMTTAEAVQRYAKDPRVRYIEPNYIAQELPVPENPVPPAKKAAYYDDYASDPYMGGPSAPLLLSFSCGTGGPISNDPLSDKQWPLHNVGDASAWGGGPNGYLVHCDADIDGLEALTVFTGTTPATIAIVDVGGWNHEDIAGNLWVNPGEDINGNGKGAVQNTGGAWILDPGDLNGIDDDGNGYVDDLIGWDFEYDDNNPGASGTHGVQVASVAAAVPGNSIGITSLSPLTRIMVFRRVSTAEAIDAIEYTIAQGARLVNASWSSGNNITLRELIQNAAAQDVLFIAAAGNQGHNNDDLTSGSTIYPASWPENNIISVAGTGPADEKDVFYQGILKFQSNYGRITVDLGAPASAYRQGHPSYNPPYASTGRGQTSWAAPHVATAAGMLWSQSPTLTYWQVKNLLLASVDPTPELWGKTVTGGRLNAYNALRLLRGLIPQDVTLDQPISDPGSHFALNTITASAPTTAVPVGTKLVAGNLVVLEPGFSVELGTPFVAEVRPTLNTWNTLPDTSGLQAMSSPGPAMLEHVSAAMEQATSEEALVASVEALPAQYALHQSRPNPTTSQATISFDLPEPAYVVLSMYDVQGRELARLVDGTLPVGFHAAQFDGSTLPSGIYLYRLQAGPFVQTGHLTLLR